MKRFLSIFLLLACAAFGQEQLYSVKVPQVFTYSTGKPQYIDRYVNPSGVGLWGFLTDKTPVFLTLGTNLSISGTTLNATGGGGSGSPGGSPGDWQYQVDASTFGGKTPATGWNTLFATPTSANLAAWITNETGSGVLVFATSPTLVTPALGIPSSVTLTNATGLPVSTGVSGLGTGIATALAINTGTAGAPVLLNGAGGTPSALVGTNITGTAAGLTAGTASAVAVGGITGLGTGVGTFLATPSSANLASAVTNETGIGALVFATSPTLVTPILGTPTSVTLTNATGLVASTGTTATGTPSSSTFLRGDNTWAAPSGTGTVTVVGAGNLTSTALVTGGGSQALQTPSATSTLDSSGNEVLAGNLTLGASTSAITGAAGNMTITSGTGNSRTMILRTTTSGGTATAALTLNADQSVTVGAAGTASGSAVTTDGTQTLTNKTLTSPTMTAPVLGTITSGVGTSLTALTAANISTGALANGMTATTQSAESNDTKLATDAYADAAGRASHLGTFASPNTAAGAITWTTPVYNIYTSAGSTRTYTLPAASTYVNKAFILNVAVGTGHVNVQPASGAALVLAGVLLTADHYAQAATSAPGNYITFISDGTNWTSLGSSGTWADAASP